MHRPVLAECELRFQQLLREPQAFAGLSLFDGDDDDASYIRDGVAVIPIHGTMLKRPRYWWSQVTSTDDTKVLLQRLMDRSDVRFGVLDIDSGGGQVAGVSTLAEAVFAYRGHKPIIAAVNEFAASGAVWVAAACERIILPRTAKAGSIGVYNLHFDESQLEEELGVRKTVVHAGRYKAINERPLTPELQEHQQGIVDRMYSEFIDAVARYRGRSAETVLSDMADGRVFVGQDAVDAGLCDAIGTLDDVLAELTGDRIATITLSVPATGPEDEEESMPKLKLNDKGQLVTDDGRAVCAIGDIEISAADLQSHFGAAVQSLIDTAVAQAKPGIEEAATKTALEAGDARLQSLSEAFADDPAHVLTSYLAGHTVEQAKASAFDKTKELLAGRDEELAKAEQKLKEAAKSPGFAASDTPGSGKPAPGADGDSVKAAAEQKWNSSPELRAEFGSFDIWWAFERHAGSKRILGPAGRR